MESLITIIQPGLPVELALQKYLGQSIIQIYAESRKAVHPHFSQLLHIGFMAANFWSPRILGKFEDLQDLRG